MGRGVWWNSRLYLFCCYAVYLLLIVLPFMIATSSDLIRNHTTLTKQILHHYAVYLLKMTREACPVCYVLLVRNSS